MSRYLMARTPEPPRQQPEVWHAWDKLLLPPADTQFIQTALWRKMAVGWLWGRGGGVKKIFLFCMHIWTPD